MKFETSTCPLCGGPNHCRSDAASRELCWCAGQEFPSPLLARVPGERAGSCICASCLADFKERQRAGGSSPEDRG